MAHLPAYDLQDERLEYLTLQLAGQVHGAGLAVVEAQGQPVAGQRSDFGGVQDRHRSAPERLRPQVVRQPVEQPPVALRGQGAAAPQQLGLWHCGQEPETDQRGRLESAGPKVRMPGADRVIETGDLLPKLATDATQQSVPEARQAPQGDGRTVLDAPVGLRERGQHHVALVHGLSRRSAGP